MARDPDRQGVGARSVTEFDAVRVEQSMAWVGGAQAVPIASASIIPALPPRPTTISVTQTVDLADGTVAAGTVLYGTSPLFLFVRTYSTNLINNGTIWSDPTGPAFTYVIANNIGIDNRGLVVIEANDITSYESFRRQSVLAFSNATTFGGFRNSGEIYAIATNGNATVLDTSYNPVVTNLGLIAASAALGTAKALWLHNSGEIVNSASGTILAEGAGAIAIEIGRGTPTSVPNRPAQLQNAGLIEAQGTAEATALLIAHSESESMTIVNSGTIRSNGAAILDDSVSRFSPTQNSGDKIVNQATGLIDGAIILERGDDVIENAGRIRGAVSLGEGSDRFDNRNGSHEGIADLGWGDDQYLGSAFGDRVAGDNGADDLQGNGGNDLLLGGGNDDRIVGGTGNDGLFGEYGNDLILTLEGDYVSGGAGDDRIELGDYKFELVDGGADYDTLMLPGTARIFDLSAAVAEGALLSIEEIEMGGSREIVVREGDIPALTDGGHQLRITGVASDRIDLVGSWTDAGEIAIQDVPYRLFRSGSETVLVSGGAVVTLMADAPTGAIGLDPIPGTELAPLPGAATGLSLTSPDLYVIGYDMSRDITVNAEEIWFNDQGRYVLLCDRSGLALTNYGLILSYSETDDFPGAVTLYGRNMATFTNYGEIAANWSWDDGFDRGAGEDLLGIVYAVARIGRIENRGAITAQTAHGQAYGITQPNGIVINHGDITAYSKFGMATAVEDFTYRFENYGDIYAEGAQEAIGLRGRLVYDPMYNGGSITAVAMGSGIESIALKLEIHLSQTLTNAGRVIGDIALSLAGKGAETFTLDNSGIMVGRIETTNTIDLLVNRGVMEGSVYLGALDDRFDGTAGSQSGVIFGEAGNDTLIGGILADRLDGGLGTDALFGGGDRDVLIGGLGDDLLDGGAGLDVVHVTGPRSAYTVTNLGSGTLRLVGPDGTDTLTSVEAVQFDDKTEVVLLLEQSPTIVLNAFGVSSAAGGWTNAGLYPRTAADVNGDGRADIIGFGDDGVLVSLANANGSFAAPFSGINFFGASTTGGGWTNASLYPRTLADVNGDGRADIVGFGDDRVLVSLANDNGSFAAPFSAIDFFGASTAGGGWTNADRYPRTAADVNGDGRADLIGFGDDGVFVSLANTNGTFAAPVFALSFFGASTAGGGWINADRYPRMAADVNGDGRADLIGFGDDGVFVALATDGGAFAAPVKATSTFGASAIGGGWTSSGLYPRMAADVNGDGRADLVGFGDGGVYVATARGDGTFVDPLIELATFGASPAAGGWSSNSLYPRLLADVTGDGQADIVAFGDGGAFIARSLNDESIAGLSIPLMG